MYLLGIDYRNRNSGEILKAYKKLLGEGIEVKLVEDPKELVDAVVRGEVSGGIRGTLPSSEVIPYLRKHIGRFYRASVLRNPFNREYFLLTPVGIDEIDEDNSLRDKIAIIEYVLKFLRDTPIFKDVKIGVLSGGRPSDYGRGERIDRSIDEAVNVVRYISRRYNIHIEHRGIVLEEYLKEGFNVILAPDGISGNLIFRSLALVCGVEGCGALLLGRKKIKFIDTSRSSSWDRYYNSIKFLKTLE
ncbi:MAG TPA: methyltransferase [Methanothermococcus okinawensis]|uniref:Methyltransferase n=1 Tax=Methanothermococcus okinawensis TaxID=155863 RepID=A0A832ZAT1_9EURY|nr:methyltransferase [Methanococcaceae archaeon]HIP84105.1 methyltransferase [Methanothermococcus okinawensis]HIP91651.1 methyltransferase [Methanothermococcus okinawensis]